MKRANKVGENAPCTDLKHRHATHARVIFLWGGGGGHCGSNEILCFVEKRN